jgi:hypothetical protein
VVLSGGVRYKGAGGRFGDLGGPRRDSDSSMQQCFAVQSSPVQSAGVVDIRPVRIDSNSQLCSCVVSIKSGVPPCHVLLLQYSMALVSHGLGPGAGTEFSGDLSATAIRIELMGAASKC